VETIARGLNELLAGSQIAAARIVDKGCLAHGSDRCGDELAGRTIDRVWRRAKLVLLDLAGGYHLAFHLKMTGKLLIKEPGADVLDKHTRLIFSLSDAKSLVFQDVRKFGYCRILTAQELSGWPFFNRLGPEPLEMSSAELEGCFQGRTGRIKPLLLNQEIIAGIGNIYADEALHLAGIHPAAPASSLSGIQWSRLHQALGKVLQEAIAAGGTSFNDYVDGLGRRGSYQNGFWIYSRSGKPCYRCGTRLEGMRVGGRSSVFCPACQTPR
jgi:formamidopyrimidine-DNA glycosylase